MRKIEGLCENCHERPATLIWVGEGGSLAMSRDYMQSVWCKKCALTEQIAYAEVAVSRLETLKRKLEAES